MVQFETQIKEKKHLYNWLLLNCAIINGSDVKEEINDKQL